MKTSDILELLTVIVGLGAIVAAIWVGNKSSKVAARQASISAEQNRIGLFDKRILVYDTLKNLIWRVSEGRAITEDIRTQYLKAFFDAKFLFEDDVNNFLSLIGEKAGRFGQLINLIEPLLGQWADGSEDIKNKRLAYEKERDEIREWCRASLDTHQVVFKRYLNLNSP